MIHPLFSPPPPPLHSYPHLILWCNENPVDAGQRHFRVSFPELSAQGLGAAAETDTHRPLSHAL